MSNLCVCCSEKSYVNCCEPYLLQLEHANSPETLMRSRYTAYSKSNIAYIQSTMMGEALSKFDYYNAYDWSSSVNWKGLEVYSHSEDGDKGEVTFVARYEQNGQLFSLKETSQFKKENHRWYYVDGVVESR
jgi:SEC-C motif domain protein